MQTHEHADAQESKMLPESSLNVDHSTPLKDVVLTPRLDFFAGQINRMFAVSFKIEITDGLSIKLTI